MFWAVFVFGYLNDWHELRTKINVHRLMISVWTVTMIHPRLEICSPPENDHHLRCCQLMDYGSGACLWVPLLNLAKHHLVCIAVSSNLVHCPQAHISVLFLETRGFLTPPRFLLTAFGGGFGEE